MGLQQGTKFQERQVFRTPRGESGPARLGKNAEGEAKMGGGVTGPKDSGMRPGIQTVQLPPETVNGKTGASERPTTDR